MPLTLFLSFFPLFFSPSHLLSFASSISLSTGPVDNWPKEAELNQPQRFSGTMASDLFWALSSGTMADRAYSWQEARGEGENEVVSRKFKWITKIFQNFFCGAAYNFCSKETVTAKSRPLKNCDTQCRKVSNAMRDLVSKCDKAARDELNEFFDSYLTLCGSVVETALGTDDMLTTNFGKRIMCNTFTNILRGNATAACENDFFGQKLQGEICLEDEDRKL